MDYGIKISKKGKNIYSPNIYDYLLNSKYAVAKIGAEGHGSADSGSIAHSLGVSSIFLMYAAGNDGEYYMLCSDSPIGTVNTFISTDLGFNYLLYGGTPAYSWHYFLLVDALLPIPGIPVTDYADYGLKISLDGKSVDTTDPRELQFNSRYKAMKIYAQGSGTTDGSGEYEISHDLDFTPAFMVWDDDNWKGAGYFGINPTSYINTSRLKVVTANPSKNFHYVIFANPIDDTESEIILDIDDVGVKMAPAGVDVMTAELDRLGLSSSLGTMQMWKKVQDLSAGSDVDDVWVEASVDHDLGFIPAWYGLVGVYKDSVGEFQVPNASTFGFSGAARAEIVADDTKFYMRVQGIEIPETFPGGYGVADLFAFEKLE